ncbi:MAG: gamma-glutamylcyclotransferase family protein [Paraclostridium sp.]|uniref:gamma-glutamylcyclotransferase family protein n=1 Tax=Paraclostridium sp. TaxID=2023273 RepID=UPI003F3F9C59
MKFKMFVYGTLMKDYHNYDKYLKEYAISHKKAYTHGNMYHLPSKKCPAVVEGDNKIYGQVIEIEDNEQRSVLKSVDYLEKYFDGSNEIMYKRKDKEVFYEDGSFETIGVYIFVNENYLKNNETILVEDGNWHEFKLK